MKPTISNTTVKLCLIILTISIITSVIFLKSTDSQQSDTASDQLAQTVNSWIGRELNLPQHLGLFTTDGDSADSRFPDNRFVILRYLDKDGCTSCRMHLSRYPHILSRLSDSANCPVGFVCIINPADMREIRRLLYRDNYDRLTMWIDPADTLNAINRFPVRDDLKTFLIDRNHKVLAIGDPAVNPRVLDLYGRILADDSINPARLPLTTLSASSLSLPLGNVSHGDTIVRTLTVRNTGPHDFVLDDVVTSCYCTTAYLSPSRIPPLPATRPS